MHSTLKMNKNKYRDEEGSKEKAHPAPIQGCVRRRMFRRVSRSQPYMPCGGPTTSWAENLVVKTYNLIGLTGKMRVKRFLYHFCLEFWRKPKCSVAPWYQ